MLTDTIITIDGPAGSGKSTIAKALAQKLKIAYLNTGAMYRAVTLAALEQKANFQDPGQLAQIAETCSIAFSPRADDEDRVLLDGKDVTQAIRSPQVTNHAHYVAGAASVRSVLVTQQRRIAHECRSLVTEGRDQGTVVFPEAPFKFYLDASPQVRAQRRFLQLRLKNPELTLEQVLCDQQQRDQRDALRQVGPLAIPPDARVVDTSQMTVEQVVAALYNLILPKSA